MLTPQENAKSVAKSMQKRAQMPFLTIVLMSIMAGGAIAMGDIFWAHSTVGMAQKLSYGMANFIGGLAFSSGLMMVVFYGGHLFTGAVMSGVSAYDGGLAWGRALWYWGIVWVFNFVGSVLVAYMYFYSLLPMKFDAAILKTFVSISSDKVILDTFALFLRAIFCNIFVCMGVWIASMQQDLVGKFFAIMWMVAAFVACSMEHCVANMFIITQGLLAKSYFLTQMSLDEFVQMFGLATLESLNVKNFLIHNLLPVTIGNIIGGLVFVGFVGFVAAKREEMKD